MDLQNLENRTPAAARARFFKKQPFEDNIDFGFDFGANLPPCWALKSKIFRNSGLPRGLQNCIVFWHRFFIDFGSVLVSNMGPSWEPKRRKIRKNGAQGKWCSPPKSVLKIILLDNLVYDRFGVDFGGGRARFFKILG